MTVSSSRDYIEQQTFLLLQRHMTLEGVSWIADNTVELIFSDGDGERHIFTFKKFEEIEITSIGQGRLRG